ncbi:MAG: hypothetical protein LBL66_07995 [Clostridiales bacterium]|jgi:hypothetical protein|nr:hypothetical protein [Clostridiales bacterium]
MFKFDGYPLLKKCHIEYDKLTDLCYELEDYVESLEEEMTVEEKKRISSDTKKRMDERDRFGHEVVAKEVYATFNKVKPVLRKTTGGSLAWDDRFGRPFEELTYADIGVLIGLIEEETIYRLPPQYYDEESKRG